jgi:hypothetical protein
MTNTTILMIRALCGPGCPSVEALHSACAKVATAGGHDLDKLIIYAECEIQHTIRLKS